MQNTWTRRYNVRRGKWGHVFGDRYKSVLCDNGDYLQTLIEYVHLNPVRVGLVRSDDRLESYEWSSLADYALPARKRRAWLAVGKGLNEFRIPDTAAGRQSYLTGLNETIDWKDPKRAGLVLCQIVATALCSRAFGKKSPQQRSAATTAPPPLRLSANPLSSCSSSPSW